MLFALHLPNHTLNLDTTVATTLLGLVAGAMLVRSKSWSAVQPSLRLFAAVTAFVFAVQMANFPLLDGVTSGHLLGSAVAAILLGPLAGCAAMALVLVLQAVVLGDGGTLTLGANVLNMALVSTLAAYGMHAMLRRVRNDALGTLGAALVAGWAASVAAAIVCAVELTASGVGSFGEVAATLVGQHAWLGLIEGVATVALVAATLRPASLWRKARLAPALIAAAVALALLPLSSELPDTLEAVLAPTATAAK
jgi:cobalt/nickel transport system permease protein